MTFSSTRLTQCATLLLALSSVKASVAQSTRIISSTFSLAGTPPSLPDAPSSSSSQQPVPQQPAKPDIHPDPATDPCKKISAALPGETEEQHHVRDQHEEAACEVKEQEQQRFGGVIPQFNVVMNGQGVPLTAKQKFNISLHTIIDPYTIGLAFLVGGGIGELEDSHTGYGHGPAGFFKRVAASYADNVDGNLIGNALLPVVLHQDPRYFRKGTGSIPSRILYSAMTTFICRGDNGKREFNTSNVAGNFIAGAISNAYYPSDERGVGLTLENGLVVTVEGMAGAQILEFSPDITSYIHRRREHHRLLLQQKQQGTSPAAAGAGTQPAPAQPVLAAAPPAAPPNL